MALKALMLRKQLDGLYAQRDAFSEKTTELEAREAELEEALNEAKTEEELETVRGLVENFDTDKRSHEEALAALEADISAKEDELRSEEAKKVPAAPAEHHDEKREETIPMKTRAFNGMTMEARAALLAREDVKEFLARFRTAFAGEQTRAVSGGELLIPEYLLPLFRQNIETSSRLLPHLNLVRVRGRARQPIMGNIPEAVWTEMCGALNELYFTVGQTEVEGYKVGGYVSICNSVLADSDGALLAAIIEGGAASIAKALDKATLYGTGVKMPTGIVTRLKETSEPANYPANARPWQNLSQSNMITIASGTTGIALFQAIATAAGAAKGKYSTGRKVWAMNETTWAYLQVQAMSINAAGAIVSGQGMTMPVIGGDVVILDNEVIADMNIVGGYGDAYLMAEREGASVGASDQPLYVQDQTVVKFKARYDGKPSIPEAFVAIGIGAAPADSADFAQDFANPVVAALSSLAVGSLTLDPTFDPAVTEYTAATTNATNTVSVVPTTGATAVVKVNGSKIANGTAATWEAGENTVSITVNNGDNRKVYTVAVTKS